MSVRISGVWQKRRDRILSYVRAARERLIESMGGACELCGVEYDLEFDHPNGREWEPRKLNRWARLAAYRRDLAAGNLRLLCGLCNKIDGGRRAARRRKIMGRRYNGGRSHEDPGDVPVGD